MLRIIFPAIALSFFAPLSAVASEADVLSVQLKETAPGVFTITAEVEHPDEGWDHFANAWDVVTPTGDVIATRELAHPHMNEQPFIRSLPGVKIPAGVSEVTVRAQDSVHGLGGKTVTVIVPQTAGE